MIEFVRIIYCKNNSKASKWSKIRNPLYNMSLFWLDFKVSKKDYSQKVWTGINEFINIMNNTLRDILNSKVNLLWKTNMLDLSKIIIETTRENRPPRSLFQTRNLKNTKKSESIKISKKKLPKSTTLIFRGKDSFILTKEDW